MNSEVVEQKKRIDPTNAEDRLQGIGCSEISAIMGLNRWMTPLNLWAIKTKKVIAPDLSDFEAVRIGNDLEEYVSQRFMEKTGFKVRRDRRTFTHPEYPYIFGHIDRLVLGEDAVLECKTGGYFRGKEWLGDDMPPEYIIQLNGYLGLTGRATGYCAALLGGQKFAWKKLSFDPVLFDKMIDAAVNFWQNHVLADVPPLAQPEDAEILQSLFKDQKETVLDFSGEQAERLDALIDERQGGLEQKKLIEEEVERLSNQIKQHLGEAEAGFTGKYRITWKRQRVAPFINVDAMKSDGVYSKYEMDNQSRVLRTKALKGAK